MQCRIHQLSPTASGGRARSSQRGGARPVASLARAQLKKKLCPCRASPSSLTFFPRIPYTPAAKICWPRPEHDRLHPILRRVVHIEQRPSAEHRAVVAISVALSGPLSSQPLPQTCRRSSFAPHDKTTSRFIIRFRTARQQTPRFWPLVPLSRLFVSCSSSSVPTSPSTSTSPPISARERLTLRPYDF